MKNSILFLGFVFLASFLETEAVEGRASVLNVGQKHKIPTHVVEHYGCLVLPFYQAKTRSKHHVRFGKVTEAYEQLVNGHLRSFSFLLDQFNCSEEAWNNRDSKFRKNCLNKKNSQYNCYVEIWKQFNKVEVINKMNCNDVNFELDDKQVQDEKLRFPTVSEPSRDQVNRFTDARTEIPYGEEETERSLKDDRLDSEQI